MGGDCSAGLIRLTGVVFRQALWFRFRYKAKQCTRLLKLTGEFKRVYNKLGQKLILSGPENLFIKGADSENLHQRGAPTRFVIHSV